MKHLQYSVLLLLCVFGVSACAEGPAGIVLYFRSGDEVYLLLADHASKSLNTRGWAAFGGGAKDGESTAETAARETEEETRGYFSQDSLLEKIEGTPPALDGTFSLYFAEVPFVPVTRVQNNRPPEYGRHYAERGPYAWIPFSEVRPFLAQPTDMKRVHYIEHRNLPDGRQTDWFWAVWIRNLRAAVESNALPWN